MIYKEHQNKFKENKRQDIIRADIDQQIAQQSKVGSLKRTNKIDKAMVGFIVRQQENSLINKQGGINADSFIHSLNVFEPGALSSRNTAKIKANKSLTL